MDQTTLTILLVFGLIVVASLALLFGRNNSYKKEIGAKIWKEISQIETMVKSNQVVSHRDLIVRLDTLLSKSFQLYYNNKDTCGNNLKKSKHLFSKETYQELWEVHKLRNQVVHDNLEVQGKDASKSLLIIKKAVRRLIYG